MKLEFGFGKGIQTVELPEDNLMGVLTANTVEYDLTGEDEVERALAEPIGAPKLEEVVKPGEKIAIVTSDITRPCPTWQIMPALLRHLYAAGVKREDITLVFALGSHRHHTPEEMQHLAGDLAYNEITCVDSNPDDCINLGVTKSGTPVDITRVVAEADRRICLANIEYHYFAGYSGGAKSIMPGVSNRAAIQSNHSMMVRPEAHAGRLAGNPIREDIEEAAAICGIDYIVNVVLDEHKQIIKAVAGDVTAAHRAGCAFLDTLYRKEIAKKADIVLADLPCSGLGVLRKKRDLKYRMTPEQQQELVRLQREILSVVWRYVKPGGTLIYSTCTVHKEENEGNTRWFLTQFPFILKEQVQMLPGVDPWDGFYMAKMERRWND